MEIETNVRRTADEMVRATARLPSARTIKELMMEYVSQESQERRMVVLFDFYSCLMQHLDGLDQLEDNNSLASSSGR
jgi:hypothetical protein